MGIAGVQREHAGEDFVGSGERAFRTHGLGGRGEYLPRFGFLSQPDVDFRQLDPHRGIFRIHFEDLLENTHRIIELAGLQEFFRHLQILGAGVVEKTLLGVKLGQLQHALERRLEFADLFVHRDGLDRESLAGIGIADGLEAFGGFVAFPDAGIEVADGVGDGQVLGVILEDFVVLSDGIL